MVVIDKSKPVLLTGATGYVAGWIAKFLMEDGMTVHAPIRNPEDKNKTKYLDEIARNSTGSIVYFKADLLSPNSYGKAMKDCELVIHTASPFNLKVKNPQKDLVDPALKGTENVLNSVNKIASVKRVVLTSSVAAIYGDSVDLISYPDQTITESEWNTSSSLEKSPYSFSKVLAEKKAWEMSKVQTRWDLITINPALVMGPGINPNGTSESFSILKQLGSGMLKFGAPNLKMGCVDVRDVATAHLKAAFTPNAKGRYIASAETISILGLADMLRPTFGKTHGLPKKNLPKWLLLLLSPAVGITRQFVRDNIGYEWRADNSKIKEDLGVEFRSISTSVNEFFEQMIEAKLV